MPDGSLPLAFTQHRVAAVRERSRRAGGGVDAVKIRDVRGPQEPSEEEIEWELLQRKEATGSGRTS